MFDTATGGMVLAAPGPVARMYVCGITPYDATHIGHAATYLTFDLLNRAWRDAGHDVRYVQNVTDVDDPLLQRAAATGVDWQVLAKEQTDLFAQDMAALGVLPPDSYVGAVEGIPLVVRAVERLLESGHAYRVPGANGEPDGDVYFRVHDDPRFGGIAHLDEPTMLDLFAERGGDPQRPGKHHPLDCLVWRVERPNEPAWDGGSLGRGRPGWHIECTTIALEHLGVSFDIQGGGADLTFPHHEMGAAEGHLLAGGPPYARAYVHVGLVGLDGHKMSKSRGNLVFIAHLRADGVDPAVIRAGARLARWRAAGALPEAADSTTVLARIRDRIADDLDAPGALAAVDAWASDRLADADGPDSPHSHDRPGGHHRPTSSVPPSVPPPVPPSVPQGLVPDAVDALLGIRL
jgi:L-cysteine:1D-myo-inositol 2-amino-2-deoxy-alpha-D-glucopyranoside ligase